MEHTLTLEATMNFCVITWNGENHYSLAKAVKCFKHEKTAQKHADKLNAQGGNYVVRTIALMHP